MICFKRHGSDPKVLEKKGEHEYVCTASDGEILFSLKIKTAKGEKLIDEIVFDQTIETEETSLKFSNLSREELSLWKRGTPSQALQYELSFWSDFAKWMLLVQEFGKPYSIDFNRSDRTLPKRVTLGFEDIECQCTLAEVNWEEIIPSLMLVNSPLVVHEFRDVVIRKMEYQPNTRSIRILFKPLKERKEVRAIKVGEWEFYPDSGFFPTQTNPFLHKKVISEREIGKFLSQNFKIVKKYLTETPLSRKSVQPAYQLHFDEEKGLHIVCFILKGEIFKRVNPLFLNRGSILRKRGFILWKRYISIE